MAHDHRLGELEELVLLAVLRLGEGAYGATVRRELKERARRSTSVSTIYVTLMRLEEKGYVRSWRGEATAVRGGKARRHFALRPEGLEALETARAVRERMWEGVRGAEGGARG